VTAQARPVVAEGERSVAVAGSTRNTLIITGDRNTVDMRLQGIGAVLAFAFRWDRPRRRRRRDRSPVPPRFADHVDREDEVLAVAGARAANLYGEQGVGKTRVLVEALSRRQARMRHGAVYLDGRDQSPEDLLHAVAGELYEVRVQRRDLRIERTLTRCRALVALEDVDLPPEEAQRLVLAAPRCRFVLTSAQRLLFEGTPLRLAGLAPEHASAIAELDLGRPLSDAERDAAEAIAGALGGGKGIAEVRGMGMMIGIEFDEACGELVKEALEAGLVINVTVDKVVRMLPPLVMSEAEGREVVSRFLPLARRFLEKRAAA